MLENKSIKKSDQEDTQLNRVSNEKQLIENIRDSDPGSFKIIFYKYYETIYRYIWIRIHDSELARDITQDVFIRVWDKRCRLNINKSFKAYLYQITNNLIIDTVRKNKTKEKYKKDNHSLNYYESENKYYLNIDIQNALNRLPEKLKTVIILSRFEGLTYMEIAEICNVSFQTIGFRLNKALQLMHKYLASE